MAFVLTTQRITFALALSTGTVYAASAAELPLDKPQQQAAALPRKTASTHPAGQATGKLEEITAATYTHMTLPPKRQM